MYLGLYAFQLLVLIYGTVSCIVTWLYKEYSNWPMRRFFSLGGAGKHLFTFKILFSEGKGIFILYFASKVQHKISNFRLVCVSNSSGVDAASSMDERAPHGYSKLGFD
jgi:hypothetical protein